MNIKTLLLSKRITALVLVFCLMVSCLVISVVTTANSDFPTPVFLKDEILNVDICNNKDEAKQEYGVFDFEKALTGVSANNVKLLFGDFLPKSSNNNKFMNYKGTNYGFGLVHLGIQYNSIQNKNIATNHIKNAVQAQKGAAYKIEYDLTIKGGTSSNGLEIGVGVAKGSYSSISNNPTVASMVKSEKMDVLYEGNTIPDVTSEKRIVYYTLDYEAAFSGDYKYLAIYVKGAKSSNVEVNIDNVKITGLAPVDVNFNIDGSVVQRRFFDGIISEPTDLNTPSRKAVWFEDAELTSLYNFSGYVRTGVYSSTPTIIYGYYQRFKYDNDKVLYEYDYEGDETKANIKTSIDSAPVKNSDLIVSKDPTDDTNTVLRYSQHRIALGVVQIGFDYSNTNYDTENSVKVHTEAAYKVEFDYMAKGEVKSNALKLGIAVGATSYVYAWPSGVCGDNYLSKNVALYDEVDAFDLGIVDSGWKRAEKIIVVPADADLSVFDSLQLYAIGGSASASVYFDNVKITGLAPVDVTYEIDSSSETKRYADGVIKNYEKKNEQGKISVWYTDPSFKEQYLFDPTSYIRTDTYSTLTLYGKWEAFSYISDTLLFEYDYEDNETKANIKTSIDSVPVTNSDLIVSKDPIDDTNTVMRYSQHRIGLGVVQLGYKYGSNSFNYEDRINVYPGTSYKITFDYLVKGTPKNNQLRIGVAVGSTNYTYGWPSGISQENYLKNVAIYKQIEAFAPDVEVDAGWKTAELILSIPSDCDISVYDALQLYAIGGNTGVSTYFDNVKIIGMAKREYIVKFETNGGDKIKQLVTNLEGLNSLPTPIRSDGYFLGWYSDKELTKDFDVSEYVETVTPITVYAKWHIYTNGAVINVDDHAFWKNANGTYLKVPVAYTIENVSGNNVVRYYAGKAEDGKFHDSQSDRGNYLTPNDTYAQILSLFDPDKTIAGKYGYQDALRLVEVGKTYRISFRYKVVSAETKINFTAQTAWYPNTTSQRVSHASICSETGKTDWKTVTTYFTVSSLADDKVNAGILYPSNGLGIGVSGIGEVLIDDISLMDWDKADETYIIFSTNGGEEIPAREYLIDANTKLPKANKYGYTFENWYIDAKCTKTFNPATYKRDGGKIILYAGYVEDYGQTTIDFDVIEYYKRWGARSETRLGAPLTYETEDGNNFLKYKMRYSATERIEKVGNCVGNYGDYGAVAGLFYPAVYADKNATFEDAEYIVKEGESYYITLKYKALGFSDKGDGVKSIRIGIGATNRETIFKDRSTFATFDPKINSENSKWQTAHVAFTVPKLSGAGDRLSLFVYGYGELLIDDVVITTLENGYTFETYGGEYVEPIVGKVGSSYQLPTDVKKDGTKFIGWYTDSLFTSPIPSTGIIEKGIKKLYAKYIKYQYKQDFEPENYFNYKSNAFEWRCRLNTPQIPPTNYEWYEWTGKDHIPDGVRSGSVSVMRTSSDQYEGVFSLYSRTNPELPLVVGEEYTISFWVKVEDYIMDGDINLWFTNELTNIREGKNWDTKVDGARSEPIINLEAFKDYMDGWVEIKYDFKARGQYVGLGLPGLTDMFVDDVCITLKSADSSYSRSIDGPGVKFEDWYKEMAPEEIVVPVAKEEKIIIKPLEFKEGIPVFVWCVVAAGGLIVIMGTVLSLALFKKRRAKRREL